MAGNLGIELGNDRVGRLEIVMGIFRHALASRQEGHLFALVPHQRGDDIPDGIKVAAHAIPTALDVVPVPNGNSDATRFRCLVRSQNPGNPVRVGEREHRIGHHMAFAGVLNEIDNMVLRPGIAKKNERAPVKDRFQFLAIVFLVEGPQRLREEHGILTDYRIDAELIETPFEVVVLDEVGSARRDDEVSVPVDLKRAAITVAKQHLVDRPAPAEAAQGLEYNSIVERLDSVLQDVLIVAVLEDGLRQEFVKFEIRIFLSRVKSCGHFRLAVEDLKTQILAPDFSQDVPDR